MSQFHIARDGQQLGVFAESEVQSGIDAGRILGSDLFWTEGMADWQPVSSRFATTQALTFPQPPSTIDFNPYAAPQANILSPAMVKQHSLASRGSRLGAAFLDGMIGLFVVGIPMAAGIATISGMNDANDSVPVASIICFVIAGIAFLGLTIYNIVLLATRGQTIAKKWLGIRIVNQADGQNPGFVKAFLLRSLVNGIIAQIVPFYPIVDACFIFREDQRCLHDLIADTTVVQE